MEANGQNQDDLILKQQEEIQQNIAASSDVVSDKLPLKVLEEEFSNDEVYKSKIAKLSEKYSEFRRIRPDGNCFFRAVGFRLFEWLLEAEAEFEKVKGSLEPSKDQMVKLGMPEFTVEDFYDNFMDTFNSLSGEQKTNLAWLIDLASAGVRVETLPSITVSRRTVSLRYTSSTDPATMTSYT